jgi:hypothetical protein
VSTPYLVKWGQQSAWPLLKFNSTFQHIECKLISLSRGIPLLVSCFTFFFLQIKRSVHLLNCMAVSDARGHLLDISIIFGGSSADSVAFHASDLYKRLLGGLLKDGYVLFGDNAYINSKFMATPSPNVLGGSSKTITTFSFAASYTC